jgi:hypothetical protein
VFQVKSGTLTLTGKGTVTSEAANPRTNDFKDSSSVIRVGDDGTVTEKIAAGVVIGEDVTIEAPDSYGITVFGSKTAGTATINGKVHAGVAAAISGNGSKGYGDTTITINSTAEVISDTDAAIYNPQTGSLIINGGVIKGTDGIEIKSGDTTISVSGNPTITATAALYHKRNSNGTSTKGYAIALVENADYAGKAKVTIHSGTYTGPVAIVQDDEVASDKKGTITIDGGTFSTDPSNYVASGKAAEYSNGVYTVREKVADEVLEKPATAEPAVDVSGITGDEETIQAIAKAAASVEVSDVVIV